MIFLPPYSYTRAPKTFAIRCEHFGISWVTAYPVSIPWARNLNISREWMAQ